MTTSLTLRNVKGSPLTYTEVDDNFTNLKDTADGAATDVAALLTTVSHKAEAAALGVGASDSDMGTFTGVTIPDASDAKEALQALETTLETKANASALGVSATAADMGTFTGSTIPDSNTAKQALQSLETAVEARAVSATLAATGGAALIGADDAVGGSLWTTVQGFINKLLSSAGSSVIGFIQDGTGAVWRSLQAKGRDSMHARDFGVVADGATDDTTALAAAINAAVAANRELILPAGTIKVTSRSTITLPNSASGVSATNYFAQLRIRGEGFSNTIINCTASGWIKIVGSSQQHSFDLQDFTLSSGTSGGYIGIEADCSAYPFFGEWTAPSRIKVHFRGNDGINNVKYWGTAFDGTDWSNIDFTGSKFDGASTPNGIGVYLRASAGSYVCQFYFGSGTEWRFLTCGFKIGKGVQSIKMVAPFFAMCANNVLVPASLTNLQDFQITNPISFSHAAGDSFVFASAYPNFVCTGGVIAIHDGYYGFKFATHDMTTIQGVQFIPDTTANGATGAIMIDGSVAGTLFIVDGCTAASTTLLADIKSTSTGAIVTGSNRCTSNMTLVADSGTSSIIGYKVSTNKGAVGYSIGAGNSVTQATNKSTAVTIDTPTGKITTASSSLAAGASNVFTVNNAIVKSTDTVSLTWGNGNYTCEANGINNGSFKIYITNSRGGVSLSDAVTINYNIISGSIT